MHEIARKLTPKKVNGVEVVFQLKVVLVHSNRSDLWLTNDFIVSAAIPKTTPLNLLFSPVIFDHLTTKELVGKTRPICNTFPILGKKKKKKGGGKKPPKKQTVGYLRSEQMREMHVYSD